MTRAFVISVVLLGAAGCAPFTTCSTDDDCAPTGVCRGGFCLSTVSVVDGGGASDAGRDAGTIANADGGNDASVDAGQGVDAGGSDAGDAHDAGTDGGGAIDAGPDDAGEPDASIGCGVCPDGFACDQPSQTCVLQVLGLSFVRPDANDVFGGAQPVRLEVQARLSAPVTMPSTLSLSVMPNAAWAPGPLLVQPGSSWLLDTNTPGATGTYLLTATWNVLDAGFVASTVLTVDARRPAVSLALEPAPARANDGGYSERDNAPGFTTAFKRDEFAELRVQANELVTVATSDFGLPANSMAPRPSCTTTCATAFCACFQVNLSRLRLDGVRDIIDAGIGPLTDVHGNRSNPTSIQIPITRWRWQRILLEQGRTSVDALYPPVIDDEGRVHVVVGYTNTNEGAVWQVTAAGQVRVDTTSNFDDRVATPMIEGRTLVVQRDDQQIRRYDTAQPSVPVNDLQPVMGNFWCNEHSVGPSLIDGRLFMLGTNGGRLYTALVTATSNCSEWNMQPGNPDFFAPGGVVVATPHISNSFRVFYARRDPRMNVGMYRVDYLPTGTPNFQGPLRIGNPAGANDLVVFGQVVATSSAQPNTIASVSAFSPDLTARVEARADAGSFGPLVAAGTRANPVFILGDSAGLLHRVPYAAPPLNDPDAGIFSTPLSTTVVDPLVGSQSVTAPVLGANGLIYTVSPTTGRLSAVNMSGAVVWSTVALQTGAVSPALDVLRDRSTRAKQCGRGLGVLYVAARNDSALTAIIVDSLGLDRNAPWPRFRHDNGSTGNPESLLTAWSCP